MTNADSFPPEAAARLETYVYRLIDPRNGETFYVGKGRGDRVFAHVRAVEGEELDPKLQRIHDIRLAGLEVGHVIHRDAMDDATALHVEAAVMDAYPGLTNIASGYSASDLGAAHSVEIIRRYSAEPAVFRHKVLLISVNRSAAETSLYDATRYAWRIRREKAVEAEVVLATLQGLIVGAFIADDWLEATPENFPGGPRSRAASASSAARPRRRYAISTLASACLTNTASPAPRTPSSTPRPADDPGHSLQPVIVARPALLRSPGCERVQRQSTRP